MIGIFWNLMKISFWEKSRVWRGFLPNVGTLPRRFFLQILICVANSPTLDILEDFSLPMHIWSGNFYSSTNPDFGGERNYKKSNIWLRKWNSLNFVAWENTARFHLLNRSIFRSVAKRTNVLRERKQKICKCERDPETLSEKSGL